MKRKVILAFILSFICLLFASCGFVEDENLVITSIQTESLDDGRTMVVITYADEDMDPQIFYIPKGIDGTGIKDIYYNKSEDGTYTTVDIYYTDSLKAPVSFKIPTGVSVDKVTSTIDPVTGNSILTVHYSDGSKSEPIVVNRGEKGEAGTSITGVKSHYNEKTGQVELYFEYSDNTKSEIFYIPEGKQGNGIKEMIGYEDSTKYYIDITFTDPNMKPKTLEFTKPTNPNTWINNSGKPDTSAGQIGDFCYDYADHKIWRKSDTGWIEVVDFDTDEEERTVTFNLNAEDASIEPYESSYNLKKGSCFAASNIVVPYPTRTGYDFAGWYATPNPIINVNGMFTDLTIVNDNLTLYAKWVPKA